MKTVEGIHASAVIFTDETEEYALAQIKMLCDNEAFRGSRIRIMPDVHPGKVGTIGFTATVGERILPGVVGIDIGCGMTVAKLRERKTEYQRLDRVVRENVPSGFQVRAKAHRFSEGFEFSRLRCSGHINCRKAVLSLGTLGGGNHFIEIDRDGEGCLYAAVHSGSRHLGKEVTEYYLRKGQEKLKAEGAGVPYELTYLTGGLKEDYLHDLDIVKEYADLNREAILDELLKGMKWKAEYTCSSAHNYVDTSGGEMLLRKGAVSAGKGETVIIPVNMRDGILLGTGRGNAEWNRSAPHGAGRIMRRGEVGQNFTVAQFKAEMKGIHCSCIGRETLDEAPFAYRGIDGIKEAVSETVDIQKTIRPVYNFKAGNR